MASTVPFGLKIRIIFVVGSILVLILFLFFSISVRHLHRHHIHRRRYSRYARIKKNMRLKTTPKPTSTTTTPEPEPEIPKEIIDRMDIIENQLTKLGDSFQLILSTVNKEPDKINLETPWNYGVENINHFWQQNLIASKNEIAKLYQKPKKKNLQTRLMTNLKCKEKLKVLILVPISLTDFEGRQLIRETWGKDRDENPKWRTYFLIGKTNNIKLLRKIETELNQTNDLILGNVIENEKSLFHKTLMGIEWASKYCPHEFTLICNQNVFINTKNLLTFLNSQDTPQNELYGGHVYLQASVHRKGEYAIDRKEFVNNIFPRYCSGAGYLLSRDVELKMLNKMKSIGKISIIDMYIGLLAFKSGIDAFHIDEFELLLDEKKCPAVNKTIVYHPVTSAKCMNELYEKSMKSHR